MKPSYKRLFISTVIMIMIVITGCGNTSSVSDENSNQEQTEETKPANKKSYESPTEVMTPEETAQLKEGQFLSAAELTKIPDVETLEKNDLAFVYVYTNLLYQDNPDPNISTSVTDLPIEFYLIRDNHVAESELDQYAKNFRFEGLEIHAIAFYRLDENSEWEKMIKYEEENVIVSNGPVLSEAKINELNEEYKWIE